MNSSTHSLLVFVLVCLCFAGPATAQCIDFDDYLHWTGSVETSYATYGVAVSGNHAYVADAGLYVIDITYPNSPQIVGSVGNCGQAHCVAVSGSYAYLADDFMCGLLVIDISDPRNPQQVAAVVPPGKAFGVDIAGTYAYVGDGDLQVIDIASPLDPQIVASASTMNRYTCVLESGSPSKRMLRIWVPSTISR